MRRRLVVESQNMATTMSHGNLPFEESRRVLVNVQQGALECSFLVCVWAIACIVMENSRTCYSVISISVLGSQSLGSHFLG